MNEKTEATEFVRLNGEPWHGDSANLIQSQARVGGQDGPFIYIDRVSKVNVMKRSEWRPANRIETLSALRYQISELAEGVILSKLSGQPNNWPVNADLGEFNDNIMLAYRHLEDARMRLGKAIQAYDGGISVYDK